MTTSLSRAVMTPEVVGVLGSSGAASAMMHTSPTAAPPDAAPEAPTEALERLLGLIRAKEAAATPAGAPAAATAPAPERPADDGWGNSGVTGGGRGGAGNKGFIDLGGRGEERLEESGELHFTTTKLGAFFEGDTDDPDDFRGDFAPDGCAGLDEVVEDEEPEGELHFEKTSGSVGFFPLGGHSRSPLRLGTSTRAQRFAASREMTPLDVQIRTPIDLGSMPFSPDPTPIHSAFSSQRLQQQQHQLPIYTQSVASAGLSPSSGLDLASPIHQGPAEDVAEEAPPDTFYSGADGQDEGVGLIVTRENTPIMPHSRWMGPGMNSALYPAALQAGQHPHLGFPMNGMVMGYPHGYVNPAAMAAMGYQPEALPIPAVPAPPPPAAAAAVKTGRMQGSPVSAGSVGHPQSCGFPCKYAFRRGCKDGTACTRCHLCPWTREAERQARLKAEAAKGSPSKGGKGTTLPS